MALFFAGCADDSSGAALSGEVLGVVQVQQIAEELPRRGGCGYLLTTRSDDDTLALTVDVRSAAALSPVAAVEPVELKDREWRATLERGEFLSAVVCDDQEVPGEQRSVSESWKVDGTLVLDPLPEGFEPCGEPEATFTATLTDASYTLGDGLVVELGDVGLSSILWACRDFGG